MGETTEFISKRKDYISYDECFMNCAIVFSKRSKDPSTQVGACIVNSQNRIMGLGYNGLPRGMDDDKFNWSRSNDYLDSKYPYVCHAEMNAIANCNQLLDLGDSTMYTTLYPCNECAKMIIQKGIRKVVYQDHKYEGVDSFVAAEKMLKACGVEVVKYNDKLLIK